MRSCKTKQRFRDFDASNSEDNHGISRFAATFPARFPNLCVPSTAATLPYRLIRRVIDVEWHIGEVGISSGHDRRSYEGRLLAPFAY
eukprot:2558700-Pleurochrysis_carterae.AAC.1